MYLCSGDFIPTSDRAILLAGIDLPVVVPSLSEVGVILLILLLSAGLNVVLPQPRQVVTAYSAPQVASKSFYLSCLYFCIWGLPTLIGKGNRRPSDLLVSPQPLHEGARQTRIILYLLFLFCGFFYLESWHKVVSSSGWGNTLICYQLPLI